MPLNPTREWPESGPTHRVFPRGKSRTKQIAAALRGFLSAFIIKDLAALYRGGWSPDSAARATRTLEDIKARMEILPPKRWTGDDVLRLLGCTQADLRSVDDSHWRDGVLIVTQHLSFLGFVPANRLRNEKILRPMGPSYDSVAKGITGRPSLVPNGAGVMIVKQGVAQWFLPANWLGADYKNLDKDFDA